MKQTLFLILVYALFAACGDVRTTIEVPRPEPPRLVAGDRQIMASWLPVAHATSWDVLVGTNGQAEMATLAFTRLVATNCTITNLPNGETYRVWIRARSAADESLLSDPAAISLPYVWEAVGGAGFTSAGITSPRLAWSGTEVFFACHDEGEGGLMVRRWSGTQWVRVKIGDGAIHAGEVDAVDLSFDNNKQPSVAFRDGSLAPKKARVLQFNGSLWQQIGQNLPTNTAPSCFPSIVHSYNYDPMIRWIAYRSEGNIITGKLVSGGTDWHAVFTNFPARVGLGNDAEEDALALATSGEQAYLATIRSNDHRVLVLHDAGSGWVQLGSEPVSPGTASRPALVLTDSQVFLAFRDGTHDNKLSVRRYTGTAWEDIGTPGFSAAAVTSVALARSPGGQLFAACVENDRVGVYRFRAGGWQTIGPTNSQARNRTSLVLAGEEPWIAYEDQDQSRRATVLRGR